MPIDLSALLQPTVLLSRLLILLIALPVHESVRGQSGNWLLYRDGPPTKTQIASSEHLMYDRLLKRMRELIRARRYIMLLHAEDEMEADWCLSLSFENRAKTYGL